MEFNNPNIPPEFENSNIVPKNTWAAWELEYLRASWGKENHTALSIGRELHRSRNAVVGQAWRIGLSQKDPNAVRTEARRQAQRMRALRHFEERALRHFEEAGKPTYAIGELTPSHGDEPVTIAKLEHHHCRWPVEGWGHTMIYCGGAKVKGLSYCARHVITATRERLE